MRALVIHESLTGNTRAAARIIAGELEREGWQASECTTREVDLAALQESDVVIVGSWVDGLFLFGQRPGGSSRLTSLPLLGRTPAYVFATYALDPGSTLDKLTAIVEERDGLVKGGMVIKRSELAEGSREFARRVVDAAAADVVAG